MKLINHSIQAKILYDSLFAETLHYSDMKPYEMEGSQFTYHLNMLLHQDILTKNNDGTYSLTTKGKELANRINIEQSKFTQQAKVTTILICMRLDNNEYEYLIYKRLKNPFMNHMGFPTHKVWFGETIKEAAESGLEAECGLKAKAEFKAIRHYHVYHNEELVEDKIFHIFLFENPTGEISNQRDGEYMWVKQKELEKTVNPKLPEFNDCMNLLIGRDKEIFAEKIQRTSIF